MVFSLEKHNVSVVVAVAMTMAAITSKQRQNEVTTTQNGTTHMSQFLRDTFSVKVFTFLHEARLKQTEREREMHN